MSNKIVLSAVIFLSGFWSIAQAQDRIVVEGVSVSVEMAMPEFHDLQGSTTHEGADQYDDIQISYIEITSNEEFYGEATGYFTIEITEGGSVPLNEAVGGLMGGFMNQAGNVCEIDTSEWEFLERNEMRVTAIFPCMHRARSRSRGELLVLSFLKTETAIIGIYQVWIGKNFAQNDRENWPASEAQIDEFLTQISNSVITEN